MNRNMSSRITTVRTFDDPIKAKLALNYLNSEGVDAYLSDDNIVMNTWYLANAVQGIKLQVREEDEALALILLEEIDEIQREKYSPDDDDEFNFNELVDRFGVIDDEEIKPNQREANAERAFKGAVFGLLFLPIQFYVIYLVGCVLVSQEEMRNRYVWKALFGTFFSLISLTVGLILIGGG